MANPTVQLMAMYNRNRMTVLIAVLVIAFAIYMYFKGKKDGKTIIPDAPYIHGKAGIPAGFNPNNLADKLYEVMSGLFTVSGHKDAAWNQLLNLATDDMVIAVYNAFNDKYGNKGKGSLTQWIADEYYYDFSTGIKPKVLDRLKKLRLN
jgi:hypothetical protein